MTFWLPESLRSQWRDRSRGALDSSPVDAWIIPHLCRGARADRGLPEWLLDAPTPLGQYPQLVAGIDVVGMTARGWVDLPEPERQLIAEADVLLGGRRHLEQIDPRLGQQRMTWPSPLRAKLPELLAGLNGRRVVALASGDPPGSGIGTTLVDLLGTGQGADPPRRVFGGPGSIATGLVGRELRHHHRRRPGPQSGPASAGAGRTVADPVLRRRDSGGSWPICWSTPGTGTAGWSCSAIWAPRTNDAARAVAGDWSGPSPNLNVIGVTCHATDEGKILGWTAGSAGRGVRARRATHQTGSAGLRAGPAGPLARRADLGPRCRAGLDRHRVGRTDPRCRAIAVEHDPERAQRIGRNATRLGVPQVQVVSTNSADALDWLPEPDAIFLGGGADEDPSRRCWHLSGPAAGSSCTR